MAIDKVTGKRISTVKKQERKVPKYEEDYENELRRQLFEDDKKKNNDEDVGFYEEVRELHHHKRDGD